MKLIFVMCKVSPKAEFRRCRSLPVLGFRRFNNSTTTTGTVERLLQYPSAAPCGRNHKELAYLLQYHLIGAATIYYHDVHNYERIWTAAQSTEVTLVDGSPVYDVGEPVEISLRSNGAIFVILSMKLACSSRTGRITPPTTA